MRGGRNWEKNNWQKETEPAHPYNLRLAVEHFECGYIQNILVLTEGDLAKTARMLGITRQTLVRKMKKYDLSGSYERGSRGPGNARSARDKESSDRTKLQCRSTGGMVSQTTVTFPALRGHADNNKHVTTGGSVCLGENILRVYLK
jgi:hypothetical protein